MSANPKSWLPTLPWLAKPAAAPLVVRKKRTRAVAEHQKKETPAPAQPLARIALVKRAVARVETPLPAPTPRSPSAEEKALGLVPLENGEELMEESAFDPATGSISVPAIPTVIEDEEMYLDLEPVILEQSRHDEPTLAPRSDEPVAYFEDPDIIQNEKPTKALP